MLFRSTPEIRFYIRRLTGKMLADGNSRIVNFDDPTSFVIQPDAAEIAMNMDALAALMNGYILNSPQAQIKAVKLRTEGDRLHIAGSLKKGITLPFEAQANVSASNDGSIQIAVEKFSGAKIPMKDFLHSLGLNLDDMVNNKGTKGMRVEGDNLIIDPEAALPPPRIRGKLTHAAIIDQKLVLTFGQPPPPRASHAGYLWIRGGTLRFGRLEMTQADLKMIGLDAKAPFDFDMKEYNKQLIAGYSKTTPSLGLEVHMPNRSSLSNASRP